MSSEEILEILKTFVDYLTLANWARDMGRNVLYGAVSFLVWIVTNLMDVLKEMLSFVGFYNADSLKGDGGLVQTLISFKSFGVGIAILMIGLILLFGKSSQTRDIPMNILMLLLMSLMLPSIMRDGLKIVKATELGLRETQGDVAFSTVKNNVTDIYVLAKGQWKTTDPEVKSYLTDLDGFDINERILDPDDVENGDVLNYKLGNKKYEEGKEAIELDDGNGGILGWFIKANLAPKYYRWKVNWLPILITLGVLAFSLIVSLVRVGRLGIELAFNNIWAQLTIFFSFRDIKRVKLVLMEIVGGFVMLLSIFTMYYVFIYYNAYVFSRNVSVMAQLFAVIGGAWFVYDGPAIVQKTLGIDAGLSTAGSFAMGLGAKKVVDTVGSAAKTTTGAAISGAVGTAGFINGFTSGNSERKNDETSNLNNVDVDNKSDKNSEATNHEPQDGMNLTQETGSGNNPSENQTENAQAQDTPEQEKSGKNGEENPSTSEQETNKESSEEQLPEIEEKNSSTGNEWNEENSGQNETENQESTVPQKDSLEEMKEKGPKNTQDSADSHDGGAFDSQGSSADTDNYSTDQDWVENESTSNQGDGPSLTSNEPLENPFKKKITQMVNTNKHQKNMKSPIGNQVDRYKRNKEFGQDVSEWLAQRKAQKEQQLPMEKRQKNKKG